MSYRTKYHNLIWNNYLNKVFDFIGLTTESSSGCSRIKWVGCDYTKNNKPVPSYFITTKYDKENKVDIHKINVIIKSQDEYFNFKANKDHYEYFNPIVKNKQMLKLLLMMTPIVYERYCITEDTDDELKELVDMIVSDERTITQEEIINHVNVKQYPSIPGDDGELVYSFGMDITRDNGETCHFTASSKNKSVAILLLMIKTIELIDGEGPDLDESYFDPIQTEIEELFEEYAKERERNYKDLKNVVIEKEVTDFSTDLSDDDLVFVNDTNDLISPDMSSETEEKLKLVEESTDKNGTISLSNIYKDVIPIMPKDSDDEPEMDFAFI